MIEPHAYGIEVRRRDIDGELVFEARIRELPDVAEYADSPEEAYELAIDNILTSVETLAKHGKAMPAPQAPATDWSGRVILRLSRPLHRALARIAETEGCSLNQQIVNVLTYFTGCTHAEQAAHPQGAASASFHPKANIDTRA